MLAASACQTAGSPAANPAPRRPPTANPLTLAGLVTDRMRELELDHSRGARPPVPVLVLGKGITALGTVRALGRRGIPLYVAGEPGHMVTGSRWYRRLPGEAFTQDSEQELASRLEALDIPRLVLLPCSDAWVIEVSRLRPDLRDRFPASIAPTDVLRRLTDKARFAETLAELDIPHPRTTLLRDIRMLDSVPDEAMATSFLKPANSGRFSAIYHVKAMRPQNRAQAQTLVSEAAGRGLELMLQEFVPGPPTLHCFLDGFMDRKGRVSGMLARRRLRMFPTDFGNSTFTESIPLEEIRPADESLRRLLSGIGYRGVFSAEFKYDARDGLFKILEVNARPWWYVSFTADCGVDVCDMARRDALGEDIEPVTSYAIGRRCFHLRRDLQSRGAATGNGGVGLTPFLFSWIGARDLTFAWDDARPWVRDFLAWTRPKIRRRIGR